MKLEIPQWSAPYMMYVRDTLKLESFEIVPEVAWCIREDGCIEAECHQSPHLNRCVLTFRADIEDNRNWRINVWHEMLHVAHCRIDRYLETVVFPETGSVCKHMAQAGYTNVYEPYIHAMATALYESLDKHYDPAKYSDDPG